MTHNSKYHHDEEYDHDDSEPTIPCSECGTHFHEDSPCCPVCGHYPTASSITHWQIMPTWAIVLGILGIITTIIASIFV